MSDQNATTVGLSGNGVDSGELRQQGEVYKERNEWFGGLNPYKDKAHMFNDNQDFGFKINQKYVNLNTLYSHENMCVKVVDVNTKENIPIYVINDSVRLARGGDSIKNDQSVVYHNFIPNDPLARLKLSNTYHYNVRSSVEALGLYISDYVQYQATHLGDRNSDLSQIEDAGTLNEMVFRTYVKGGGAAPRDPITGDADSIDEEEDVDKNGYTTKRTWSEHLGIGLGECMVMNPVFQFNKRDDVRTNPMYTKIGRVYSTQIMNNWPVVIFQPGRLKYNTGFFKMLGLGGGAGFNDALIRSGGEGFKGKMLSFFSTIGDVLGVAATLGSAIWKGNKIVEFRQATNMYNMYVRSLWQLLSQMMGLWSDDSTGRYVYNGAVKYLDLTRVLPTKHLGGGLAKYLNNQFIPFRCQKGVVGNETFSNSTETNPMMEEMNSAATANSEEGASNNTLMGWVQKKGLQMIGMFSDKAAVMSGQGRITLPDVYASSSFQRSINLSFEFHYPYGDALGKFENTLLQFQALLAMGLARQTGKMTYTSPFALRVYIKNHIFINYGMIENISVTRGGDNNDWCADGYPKTLKVDVSVKDMEPNISLPMASRGPLRLALEVMFPTSGISEYLGSIGGLAMDDLTGARKKNRLSRAANIFRSSWGAKLNTDSFLAATANTRLLSNIMMIFKSTEIDKMNRLGDINNMYQGDIQGSAFKNTFVYKTPPGQLQSAFDNSASGAGHSTISDIKASDAELYSSINALKDAMDITWGNREF